MRVLATIALCALACTMHAQSVRSLVNGGNDQYKDKKYNEAEVNYRKALEREKDLIQGHFNLGNALAKQGKSEDAAKEFDIAREKSQDTSTRANASFNVGNTHMAAQQYGDAIKSYVEALRANPGDDEAKYNLSYALQKLRQQQQQQQKQQQEKKNDKNKNNQNKDQQKQDQKDQKKQNDQQKQQQQQQQKQEKRMSKSDADRILEVLKNNEKDVQKRLRVRPAERAKTDKDW